jgi:hypothetical protein
MNKKIAIIIIFIVLLIASNLIGGFIAFDKGFEAGLYMEGLNVSPTVAMLERLREGKTEWPIKMLETKLDWQIYNAATFKNSNDSIYNFNKYGSQINSKTLGTAQMKQAKKYRNEFPSSFTDDEFRKRIYDTLNKIEDDNAK